METRSCSVRRKIKYKEVITMKMIIFMFVIVSSLIELSETLKLIKKAVSIANNVYQKKYLTSVVWKHCDDIVVTNFLQLYEGSVVTVEINKDFDSNKIDFHKNVLYQQTVFFAVDAAEFEYFLKVINRIIVVPIKVIIVIANRELSTDFAAEFTKTAWDNDVGSIVVMGNINETIELITYFPYDNGGCGNYTPVHLNSGTTKYFKPKFRNFNGCPIRASLLEFIPYVKLKIENDTAVAIGGLDGNLLKLIIEVLNSTMDIMSANSHGVISTCVNGTRVGTFNDLVYNIADIMAPSFIIVPIRYAVSQISYVFYTVKIVWCMPNRREIYQWVNAILPFINMSTPLIILASFFIIVIIKVVKRIGKVKDKCNKGNLFEMLGIFLGQQVNINSKYRLINIMFIFWIWFSLIVRISYQGKLIDGLRNTILEPPTKTLAEAIEVVDGIGGMPTFIELYKNTSIEHKYNQIKLRELPNYMKEVGAGRRYLLAVDMVQVKYYRHKLQILEERVTSVPACIHMRPRWPAAPEISHLIGRMVDSGLIVKIWKDITNEWLLLHGLEHTTNTVKPLDIKTLSSCFYGLIIMYFVSGFVFCLEIILKRYKSKHREVMEK
ncbi:uncharacterized protein LOC120629311 [Pararge aegeria]|uniref:uncharacterized protein LOC120629311 n=1 Tax=Pararge aegeria TaxID=116150 RepID=UPI0019CF6F92|nr:uncharacterized protein LOC120629311 [Pararge aegeria]